MSGQTTETYTVRLPGGRLVTREVPVGADDRTVRALFAPLMRREGINSARQPVVRNTPAPGIGRSPTGALTRRQNRPDFDPSNPTPNATISSHSPSWGEWMGNQVYDGLNALGMPTVADRARREMSYMPLLGDAYIAGEGVSNIQNGNTFTGFGQLGLAALGTVPVVGDAAAAGVRAGARQVGGMFGGRGVNQGIRAYHVSPHDFDRFVINPNTARTGEGAQTYGFGGYFAENPAVRDYYRQQFMRRLESQGSPEGIAADLMNSLGRDRAIRELEQRVASLNHRRVHAPHTVPAEYLRGRSGLEEALDIARNGNPMPRTYEVNIRTSPERLLDWNAPFSRQSPQAQQALGGFSLPLGMQSNPMAHGEDIYREIARQRGGHVNASNALNQAGIPGIRYFDQASRDAAQGSRNYVVFDDSLIDILRKY